MPSKLALDIDTPVTAKKKRDAKPKIAPPHTIARRLGVEDGRIGQRRNAGRWPSGVYGHADYELGYQQGELEANP